MDMRLVIANSALRASLAIYPQVLSLYVYPNFKYLVKYLAQIYKAQYAAALLEPAPMDTNMAAGKDRQRLGSDLLSLSRPLIILTDHAIP